MGEDMNRTELIKKKEVILDEILQNVRSWDKTIESGISIIESNQELLEKVDLLNVKLSETSQGNHDETSCNIKLIMISKELEQLINWMKDLKKSVLDDKRTLEKREDVVGSYIAANSNSVFIDKDV